MATTRAQEHAKLLKTARELEELARTSPAKKQRDQARKALLTTKAHILDMEKWMGTADN